MAGDDPRDQQISIKNDLNCEDLLDGKIEYKKNGRKIGRAGEADNRAKLSQIKEKLKRNGRYVMSKNTPGKKMAYVAKRIDFSEIFGTNSQGSFRGLTNANDRRSFTQNKASLEMKYATAQDTFGKERQQGRRDSLWSVNRDTQHST